MERLGYIPEKLYHYTLKDNLESIGNSYELRASSDGYVYMTEDIHDACIFANVYSYLNKRPITDYVVIEIYTNNMDIDKNNLFISYDHNPKYFPIKKHAIMHYGNLNLYDANYYEFDE